MGFGWGGGAPGPEPRMGVLFPLRAWVHPNPRPAALPPTVCVKFLEDALGQKLPRRPQTGPGEQFTIFQFWSYVEALDSPSMEAYVTETAEEGEPDRGPDHKVA